MPKAAWRIGSHAVARAAVLALGVASGFALGSPAAAQAPPAPATASEATPAPPVLPYSLNEVAVQASNALARIQAKLAKLGALPDAPPIATGLVEFEHEIHRGRLEIEEALARDYSRNEVEERRAFWIGLDEDLAEPQRDLDANIVSAEAFLTELRAADARWEATLAEFALADVPASVRDNAESTLAAIREARSTVEKRRNHLLSRQAHVVALRSTVAEMRLKLDEAEAQMFRRAFQRNRAPLWRSIRDLEQVPTGRARQRITDGGYAIARYLPHHVVALSVQGVALLALIWLGWRARRATLRRSPEAPPAELPLALRHVIATGILLAIAPVPWVYSSAPIELTRIFALIVLPAWLLLLRSFLPASLHPTVVGLALIVVFETLREVMGTVLAARQLVLLLELGIAIFGVFWLRRPARITTAAPLLGAGGWVRVLDWWLWIGALLLPVGAIAAGAGFVMFAEAVLRFYVGGSYLAGLLMLAAQLATELTRAWFESGALDFLYMVRRNRDRMMAVLRRLYRAAATFTWLLIAIRNQGASAAALDALRETLAWQFRYGGAQISVGGIVSFVLTLWTGWLAGRFVFFLLDQEVFARVGLPRGIPYALATLSQYAVTTIAFLLALSALGVDLQNISILMGALGVGIGFGLQNAVSNFISGLMLLFERPIHVGDRLQIEDLTGIVSRIGIRASRLRTIEGADVIVPNSELISNRVTNWTLADRMRMVSIPVGVTYGSDLRLALRVLNETAKAHPDAHAFPAPDAIFVGFGESSVDFQVRAFADADSFVAVRTSLGLAIAEVLAAAGIAIPFPQRDLHLRSVEESILAPRTAGAPGPDFEPEAGA